MAAIRGHEGVVRLLLDRGASIDAREKVINTAGIVEVELISLDMI